MKADKTAKSFPTYRILVFSKFDSLDRDHTTNGKRWSHFSEKWCVCPQQNACFKNFPRNVPFRIIIHSFELYILRDIDSTMISSSWIKGDRVEVWLGVGWQPCTIEE